MAEVYRRKDAKLDRDIAIRILPGEQNPERPDVSDFE
jgi:hypothetical protein